VAVGSLQTRGPERLAVRIGILSRARLSYTRALRRAS
jgi:hypothetical protein